MANVRFFNYPVQLLELTKLTTKDSLGKRGFIQIHIRCRSVITNYIHKKQQQEVIEDTTFTDKPKSDALIAKVNNVIASGNAGRLFAIVKILDEQFRVTSEDVLAVKRYWAPTVGDRLVFEKVLLVGSSSFTLVGKPILPANLVRVSATVIHKDLMHTSMRFRFLHKERVHRLNFDRPELTFLRINDIHLFPKLNITEERVYNRE